MTGSSAAAAWFCVGLLLLAAVLALRRPLGRLVKLAVRSSAALALLALMQELGGLFGVTLGVNLSNALVLGILGTPGFGLLMMLQWLLRS